MADYIMKYINMSHMSSQEPSQDSYYEFEFGQDQLLATLCTYYKFYYF